MLSLNNTHQQMLASVWEFMWNSIKRCAAPEGAPWSLLWGDLPDLLLTSWRLKATLAAVSITHPNPSTVGFHVALWVVMWVPDFNWSMNKIIIPDFDVKPVIYSFRYIINPSLHIHMGFETDKLKPDKIRYLHSLLWYFSQVIFIHCIRWICIPPFVWMRF